MFAGIVILAGLARTQGCVVREKETVLRDHDDVHRDVDHDHDHVVDHHE